MTGILLSCYVVELVKYWLALRLCFSVEIRRKWAAVAGGVLYLAWLLCSPWGDDTFTILYGVLLAVLLFTVTGTWREKLKEIVLLFFVLSCVDGVFDGMIHAILKSRLTSDFLENWRDLWSSFATLVIVTGLVLWKKRHPDFEKGRMIRFVQRGMIFFVIFMTAELTMAISGLSVAGEYTQNAKFELFAGIVSTGAYLAVGMLGVFVIYIKNTNERLKQTVETERALKDMQEKYYEALLKKEEETRRYRHDLNNHFICLGELAKAGDIEGVTDYINGMWEQMTFLQRQSFSTGSKVLDALLNHYSSLLGEVKINLSGRIETAPEISEADLCTIFANLLQNAVEAVEKCREEEKYLKVQIEQGREYLKIRIENSAKIEENKKDFLKTSKEDKRNHGMGIGNVKKTVERNHGTLHIDREEKKFVAEVVLLNRILQKM